MTDIIVTPDLEQMELEAVELLKDPVVQAAKEQAGIYLRRYTGSDTPRAAFEAALERVTYCGILTSINADPKRPRIHAQVIPEHDLRGVTIMDSSSAISNPDTVYRFIPIDGDSHYVIHGQVSKHRPIETNYTLASYSMTTLGNINGRDLEVDADGRFAITIGPEPANGRKNHLRTRHDAWQMWIRDTYGDWEKERPSRLSVERTDPVTTPPLSRAAKVSMVGNYTNYIIRSMPFAVMQGSLNTFASPEILGGAVGEGGFLVTMAYSNSRFRLAGDEALVLDVTIGDAEYLVVPATNVWGSVDGDGRTMGALNNFQSDKNPDGSFTFVVSDQDPGVANWVDTGGLAEGTVFLRWAAFKNTGKASNGSPTVTSKVVKMKEIDKLLPAMRRVNKEERAKAVQWRAQHLTSRQQG